MAAEQRHGGGGVCGRPAACKESTLRRRAVAPCAAQAEALLARAWSSRRRLLLPPHPVWAAAAAVEATVPRLQEAFFPIEAGWEGTGPATAHIWNPDLCYILVYTSIILVDTIFPKLQKKVS